MNICTSPVQMETTNTYIKAILNSFYTIRICKENEVPLPNFGSYDPSDEFIINQSYHTDPKDDSLLIAFYIKSTHGDYNAVSISENKWSISYTPNGLSKEERERLPYLKKEDLNERYIPANRILAKANIVLMGVLDNEWLRGIENEGVPRNEMSLDQIKSETNDILKKIREAIIEDSNKEQLYKFLYDWIDNLDKQIYNGDNIDTTLSGKFLYDDLLSNGWTPPSPVNKGE